MDETPALARYLDALEGYPIREGMNVRQEHLYCDTCSDPIYPNKKSILYLSDEIVLGADDFDVEMHETPYYTIGDFYILRATHWDCDAKEIPFPCEGYTELWLEVEWGRDFRLKRPKLLDASSRNDGIDWNPERAHDALMEVVDGPSLRELFVADPVAMGPHDIIASFVVSGIDPRYVIDDDGEIVAKKYDSEIREHYMKGSLIEKWSEENRIPPGYRFPRSPQNELHGENDE